MTITQLSTISFDDLLVWAQELERAERARLAPEGRIVLLSSLSQFRADLVVGVATVLAGSELVLFSSDVSFSEDLPSDLSKFSGFDDKLNKPSMLCIRYQSRLLRGYEEYSQSKVNLFFQHWKSFTEKEVSRLVPGFFLIFGEIREDILDASRIESMRTTRSNEIASALRKKLGADEFSFVSSVSVSSVYSIAMRD